MAQYVDDRRANGDVVVVMMVVANRVGTVFLCRSANYYAETAINTLNRDTLL